MCIISTAMEIYLMYVVVVRKDKIFIYASGLGKRLFVSD